jgi:hypothetical protein
VANGQVGEDWNWTAKRTREIEREKERKKDKKNGDMER